MSELSQAIIDTNTNVAGSTGSSTSSSSGRTSPSWFEVMAEAWGKALDRQANRIIETADQLNDGLENPSVVNRLQAESLRMQFLSNASHTAITSVGSSLETMARKQ